MKQCYISTRSCHPGSLTPGRAQGVTPEEPTAGNLHGGVREGCALKAHGIQLPEMVTAAKPSSQPRTKSCVMSGDGHCEA
jgi:hypothetical protein